MTTMEVNLEHLKYNLNNIKSKLKEKTNIIAMVKADAYGLGDTQICKTLVEENINIFGVAHVQEAVHLRKQDILENILVVGQFLKQDIPYIVDYDISVCLSNLNFINELNEYAKQKDKIINIHLKVDTGMSRLGFKPSEIENITNKILACNNLCLDGIFTHLSSADTDEKYTKKQLTEFSKTVEHILNLGIEPTYIHCLNSAGILNFPEYQFNTVRVGDILYGYYPDESLRNKIDLKPCCKILSTICNITNHQKGTAISYSQNHILEKDSKIATVQMGYADGLFRNLSNKYSVIINGKKCKILGNICMDMFMCDVTEIEDLKIGDEVIILNDDDSIYEMSMLAGTINYEIISRISKRVERKYI